MCSCTAVAGAHTQLSHDNRRLRFSSDADIVRLTNARIIIIIIEHVNDYPLIRFEI